MEALAIEFGRYLKSSKCKFILNKSPDRLQSLLSIDHIHFEVIVLR